MLKTLLLSPALLAFSLLLILPSTAHAIPFEPHYLEATSVAARFVETGTNTACVNCSDFDPTNDLTLRLNAFSAGGTGGFAGHGGGDMTLTGYLLSIRDVDLTIEYDLRVVSQYGQGSSPEQLAAYPLPSVTYGTISGYLLGANKVAFYPFGFDLAEDCCGGLAGGASFLSPFTPPSLWEARSSVPFDAEVHWGEMPYTPEVTAVPEPTTLLLLGGGLIGAEWKRRRRHH